MGESVELLTVYSADHQKILIEGVWSSFASKRKVDLDVICNGRLLRTAHQIVLDVFLPTLQQQNAENDQTVGPEHPACNRTIDLGFALQDEADLDLLLEFIYRGRVTVEAHQMRNLLGAAKNLNIQTLVDAIADCEARIEAEVKFIGHREIDPAPHESTPETADSRYPEIGPRKSKRTPVELVQVWHDIDVSEQVVAPVVKRRGRPPKTKTAAMIVTKKSDGHSTATKRKSGTSKRNSITMESGGDDRNLTNNDAPAENKTYSDDETSSDDRNESDDDVISYHSTNSSSKEDITISESNQPLSVAAGGKNKKIRKSFDVDHDDMDGDPKLTRSEYKKQWRQTRPIQACPYCSYQTRDKIRYNIHLAKHDSNVVIFKCESCGRIFQSRESLIRHEDSHSGAKETYHCPRCPYSSPKKINYHRHITAIHKIAADGQPLQDKYRCVDCPFVCMYKSQYKLHLMMKHSSEKPFRCEECAYASIRKGDLEKHVSIVHLRSRPFLCDLCGFSSTHKGALNRHKRTHTKFKPFSCVECGQAYADSHKLKFHMQRHLNDEKAFVCHLCAKACRRRDNLQMHMKRIHKTTLDSVILH